MILISIVIAAVWFLWVAYVAIMHIKRVRDQWGLTTAQKVFTYPLAAIAVPLDVIINWLSSPLWLFDWPAWWGETLSHRLERYTTHEPWRGTRNREWARWVREDLLADFDPSGSHGEPGR